MSIEEVEKVIEDKINEIEGFVAQTNDEREKLTGRLNQLTVAATSATEDAQKLRKALFAIRGEETKVTTIPPSDVLTMPDNRMYGMKQRGY